MSETQAQAQTIAAKILAIVHEAQTDKDGGNRELDLGRIGTQRLTSIVNHGEEALIVSLALALDGLGEDRLFELPFEALLLTFETRTGTAIIGSASEGGTLDLACSLPLAHLDARQIEASIRELLRRGHELCAPPEQEAGHDLLDPSRSGFIKV